MQEDKVIVNSDVVVIVSKSDIAGLNMKNRLLQLSEFNDKSMSIPNSWPKGEYELLVSDEYSLLTIPEPQIFTDYFQGFFDTKLMIFASKHSSSAGKKSLLVHTTGVWNEEAGHGGNDHELAYAPSHLLLFAYNRIKKYQKEKELSNYWTGIECTHHGPTALEYPVIYMETGGTEEEWQDQSACNLIADVIKDTIVEFRSKQSIDSDNPTFIGIGGNHYCSSFIRKIDENDYSIGHIAPKYTHKNLPEKMIEQAYKKTLGDNKFFLIDKKGCRATDRDRFIEVIEENKWDWEFI